jgi:microcystin-dependent protein
MPNHNHAFLGTSASADNKRPVTGAAYAQSTTQAQVSPANPYYAPDSNVNTAINPSTVTPVGGSQPHNNLQPYLTVNWCICLAGIFPARG